MMSPLPVVEDEQPSNASLLLASPSAECISAIKEHNYLGLSDCSSVDSSSSSAFEDRKLEMNLHATDLKLALPGSQSPERASPRRIDVKPLFPLTPSKSQPVSSNKRVFSDATDEFSAVKGSSNVNKAQVVGWPPVPKGLKTTSKNTDERIFVKVSMDGAAILRKVDLKSYSSYQLLSSGLEKMFKCYTIGQFGSHGVPGMAKLSEIKLRDLLRGSDYVLTYEDKEGDWMLVGDVPWEMFIGSCRRLKIMKSSDAIGLEAATMEKAEEEA